MSYDTVVFDLDGTLLDTLEDLKSATNYALASYGCPQRTLEEVRRFVGNGVRRLMERAVPPGISEEKFEKIYQTYRTYYTAHCQEATCAYEGILDMLGKLQAAGCHMAIVSNKLDPAVKKLNEAYFKPYIQVALGENEEAGIRKKPAPEMVFAALKELGSSPDRAVYVGDSDVDIATAANAGLDCISVSWGFRDLDFLKDHGARLVAASPEELYGYIIN